MAALADVKSPFRTNGFSSDCSDEAAELGVDSHEWRVLARGAAIKSARLLVHNQISPIEVGVY